MDRGAALLSALSGGFWSYASLCLSPSDGEALLAACRKAGARPSTPRGKPGDAGPIDFFALLRTAQAMQGKSFLRHSGYFAGISFARLFVAPSLNPNAGLERAIGALTQALPNASIEILPAPSSRFSLTAHLPPESGESGTIFLAGFLKGMATRVNEGAAPAVTEKVGSARGALSMVLDWGSSPAPRRAGKRHPRATLPR